MIRGAIILLYHRVITLDRDPQLLCVSPENFTAQIDWLTSNYRVVPLTTIAEHIASREPMENLVAITFDDGYFDNATIAAPILRAANCPATIFTTTGLTDTTAEFFWDDLDRIFLTPGTLPQTFEPLNIDLGASATYAGEFSNWTVLDATDPTSRHATYRRLCSELYESPIARRAEILQQLQNWSSAPARATHRMMTTAEQASLFSRHRYPGEGLGRGPDSQVEQRSSNDSEAALITPGGHTIHHGRLSSETLEVQRSQIQLNRQTLNNPPAFSYPFGTRHDYTTETVQLVKDAGYKFACANFAGTVTLESDLYRLPRRIVRDWPIEQFIPEFEKW